MSQAAHRPDSTQTTVNRHACMWPQECPWQEAFLCGGVCSRRATSYWDEIRRLVTRCYVCRVKTTSTRQRRCITFQPHHKSCPNESKPAQRMAASVLAASRAVACCLPLPASIRCSPHANQWMYATATTALPACLPACLSAQLDQQQRWAHQLYCSCFLLGDWALLLLLARTT